MGSFIVSLFLFCFLPSLEGFRTYLHRRSWNAKWQGVGVLNQVEQSRWKTGIFIFILIPWFLGGYFLYIIIKNVWVMYIHKLAYIQIIQTDFVHKFFALSFQLNVIGSHRDWRHWGNLFICYLTGCQATA